MKEVYAVMNYIKASTGADSCSLTIGPDNTVLRITVDYFDRGKYSGFRKAYSLTMIQALKDASVIVQDFISSFSRCKARGVFIDMITEEADLNQVSKGCIYRRLKLDGS